VPLSLRLFGFWRKFETYRLHLESKSDGTKLFKLQKFFNDFINTGDELLVSYTYFDVFLNEVNAADKKKYFADSTFASED